LEFVINFGDMKMESKVTIELTVTEVNNVLAALSKFPFDQVADLIASIRGQAVAQVPQVDPTPEAE